MARVQALGALLCLFTTASAADVKEHTEWLPFGTQPAWAKGQRMEVSIPFSRQNTWLPCTVLGTGSSREVYNVKVHNFPEKVQVLKDIPQAALRPALPMETMALRATSAIQSRDKSEAATNAAMVSDRLMNPPRFNCTQYPGLCKAPFNCHTWTVAEGFAWWYHGMARNGQGNPRAWCVTPNEPLYLSACLEGRDLVKAAAIRHNESRNYGELQHELEASRCFIEGFCHDRNVTQFTSIVEGNKLCDARYGRDRWTLYATYKSAPADIPGAGGMHGGLKGYKSLEQTTPFTMSTCAAGKYHCDVMSCKETYCKQEYYVKKYGHWLNKVPKHY